MAPSEKLINDAIKSAVQSVYNGPHRDQLTVNQIRDVVEDSLDLSDGFLREGQWKQKSKQLVLSEHTRLVAESASPAPEEATPVKPKAQLVAKPTANSDAKPRRAAPKSAIADRSSKGKKRTSEDESELPAKRRKKQNTPSSDDEGSIQSSLTDSPEESDNDFESDASEATPAKKNTKRAPAKPQPKPKAKPSAKKAASPDDAEELSDEESVAREPKSKSAKRTYEESGSEDESSLTEQKSTSAENGEKQTSNEADSDSDMSVLIDEPPKKKRSSTSKADTKPASKSSKPTKSASAPLSPDEELIKTLQSQLLKCGIRKIWGVVLKQYGSDTKAKIRHLKNMLKEVGMEGRFSEARAKEVREARELMADLEAVKEGDAKWGMGRGSRSKKAAANKKAVESGSEDEEEDVEPPPRPARARADLAFLGDEDESDSD